ncbi:MAG: NAD(P)-binding protein [Candidatus Micrarchaeaceae archaeon]
MSYGTSKVDMPLSYITMLLVMVVASAGGTILLVHYYVGNFYDATYFTISALFDINGVSLAPAFNYHLLTFDSEFYNTFPLLMLDGIVKIVAIGFILAGIVELISVINLFEKLSNIGVRKMNNGVIVCGYNDLAESICLTLKNKKKKFVVVDKDPAKVEMLRGLGYMAVRGSFTNDDVLKKCSVQTAKSIIFSTESDFENLLGIVTAHYLNPEINIISRAREESSVTKMHRAGAGLCVVPEVLAGLDIGDIINRKMKNGA